MMHSQANIFCVNRLRLALGHAAAISGLLLELLKHQNDDIKPYPYLLRGAIPPYQGQNWIFIRQEGGAGMEILLIYPPQVQI